MKKQITNRRLKFKKWPEIRMKYIYECASLLDIAKEYEGQVSYNAIANRCKAEGWVEQRQKHWAQVEQDWGEMITAKKVEAQKMMIDSANLLIKSSKEAIEKYIAGLERKGEDLSLKEARSLMLSGFKIISYFIDKVDNNFYSVYNPSQEDSEVASYWMSAYFDLLHDKPNANTSALKVTHLSDIQRR